MVDLSVETIEKLFIKQIQELSKKGGSESGDIHRINTIKTNIRTV